MVRKEGHKQPRPFALLLSTTFAAISDVGVRRRKVGDAEAAAAPEPRFASVRDPRPRCGPEALRIGVECAVFYCAIKG